MKIVANQRIVFGLIILTLVSFAQVFSMATKESEFELPTLKKFLCECVRLLDEKNLGEENKYPLVSEELFDKVFKAYIGQVKVEFQKLYSENKAFGIKKGFPYDKNFTCPFVQKRVFNKDLKNLLFVGDIHGCLEASTDIFYYWRWNGFLDENFKIYDKYGTFAVFFGDYVDRGRFGIEVIFALILFKLENWDNVCLLQGNHEADSELRKKYGFFGELYRKYGDDFFSINENCKKLFRCFPQALFILWPNASYENGGFYCIQCCHGGIDPRYEPGSFLQNHKLTVDVLKGICLSDSGLVWNDFDPGNRSSISDNEERGRGYRISAASFNKYLKKMNENLEECRIKFISCFRAHQHPDCVCEKLGETEVYTISAFGGESFDWTGYVVVMLKEYGFELEETKIVLEEVSSDETSADEELGDTSYDDEGFRNSTSRLLYKWIL